MNTGSAFDALRESCATALARGFPGAKLEDFGEEPDDAGVKVLLETEQAMADVFLWRSLAFDVEAVDKTSGRVLLRMHADEATTEDVAKTIAELARTMGSLTDVS